MDLSTIGSIGVYTNMLKMQAKWSIKQQGGDMSDYKATVEDWIEKSRNSEEGRTAEEKNRLSSIMQKVYSGAKLTTEEKEYLRTKDPQTWQKLRSVEQEQKAYERELKKCKTKEDVQRLKVTKINSSLSTIKSVESNPNIPLAKKLEICLQEKYRCDKLEQSTKAFVKSGEYSKLPTEAEKNKAEKELHEAEESKRNPETDKTEKEGAAEKTEETDPSGQAEKAEAVSSEKEQQMEHAKQTEKLAKKVRGQNRPEWEIESPEIRKVRRAKAKAAYASRKSLSDTEPDNTLSIQA